MEINLTWDLFVTVFFLVVGAYSFMIGTHRTLKVLIGGYISIIASESLANIIQQYILSQGSIIAETISMYTEIFGLSFGGSIGVLISLKITFFLIFLILFTIHAPFEAVTPQFEQSFSNFLTHLFFSLLCGLFIIVSLLRIISGEGIISQFELTGGIDLNTFANNSIIMAILVKHLNIWFFLPSISLLCIRFFAEQGIEELE